MTFPLAAAIGGAAALSALTNGLGIAASEDAAREANDLQLQMFREQLGFNHNERLEVQKYNSPAEQRKRYEAAGINPYAMLGRMESGNVQAATAPAAPTAHVANSTPADYGRIGESLGEGFLKASQVESLNLDNAQKRIELQYKTAHEILSLQNEISEINSKKAVTDLDKNRLLELTENISMLKENLEILRSNKPQLLIQERERTNALKLQNTAIDLQNKYQSLMNDLQSKMSSKQLQLIQAQIYQAIKSGDSQAADAALKQIEKQGVSIDNYQKNQINWLIREGVKLDIKAQKLSIRQQGADYWNPFGYVGKALGGSAGVNLSRSIK